MDNVNDKIVLPGTYLGLEKDFPEGIADGAFIRNGAVYSSRIGYVEVAPVSIIPEDEEAEEGKPIIPIIKNQLHVRRKAGERPTVMPEIGAVVTGRVLRVNPRFASVEIMVVGAQPTKQTFQGIIRVQDVRATEKDKVQIYKSFRPGDIVRARVISLGDARSYFLTTAENELGVIFATSEAGHSLVAISWIEMVDPKTKVIEFRKCAKPTSSA